MKAASTIKFGSKKDDEGFQYIERGEDVSQDQLGVDDEEWEQLIADEVVMEDDKFDAVFPEESGDLVVASGTPSNLAQIEGTELQVNLPEVPEEEVEPPVNPADPPHVDGAVDPGSGEDSHGQDVEQEGDPAGENDDDE
jgi:hypothetical protein